MLPEGLFRWGAASLGDTPVGPSESRTVSLRRACEGSFPDSVHGQGRTYRALLTHHGLMEFASDLRPFFLKATGCLCGVIRCPKPGELSTPAAQLKPCGARGTYRGQACGPSAEEAFCGFSALQTPGEMRMDHAPLTPLISSDYGLNRAITESLSRGLLQTF